MRQKHRCLVKGHQVAGTDTFVLKEEASWSLDSDTRGGSAGGLVLVFLGWGYDETRFCKSWKTAN